MFKTIAACLICFYCLIPNFSFSQFGNEMLDSSFGTNGKVNTDVSENYYNNESRLKSVLIQKDGKIVTAGNSEKGVIYNLFLARYLPSGTLDSGFSQNGIRHYFSGFSYLYEAHLQADDKIVAVVAYGAHSYVTRFLKNGELDTTFGTNGTSLLFTDVYSLDVDSNDNIVVCERKLFGNLILYLQRFGKNGEPNLAFGNNNLASVLFGREFFVDIVPKVKFDKNNQIVTGCIWNPTAKYGMAIARFTAGGVLDSTFNGSGKLLIGTPKENLSLNSIAIEPDNMIVAAGCNEEDFFLIRIKPNGTVDRNFGANGFVTTDFSSELSPDRKDNIAAICIQDDGKIVATGFTIAARSFASGLFASSRYLPNGSLDTSFGQLGKIVTKFGDNLDTKSEDVALQTDGKIVVAGYHAIDESENLGGDIAIARYLKEKSSLSKQNNFIVRSLIHQQKVDGVK